MKAYLHVFIPGGGNFPMADGIKFFKNALTSAGVNVVGVVLGISNTPKVEITYQGGVFPRPLINNLKADFASALRNFTGKRKAKVVFKKLW